MKNLFSWQYWFSVNPAPLISLGLILLASLIGVFILLAVISFLFKRKGGFYRGIFRRLYDFSVANFLIGVIILFFNYENIPFFSARFWIGLWVISLAIWLYFILIKIKDIPAKKQAIALELEKKKYLP